MQITDLNNIIKKEHNFKINSLNNSSFTVWKKDIYIVKRSHNWYKIGVSNNVNNRVYQMQVCSPEKLTCIASVPLQGMVYYIERKVLETFRSYLGHADTSGEWVRLQGSEKDIIKTFEFVVNKTVTSLRRRYRADNKAIEKLITNYKPTTNAISIIK